MCVLKICIGMWNTQEISSKFGKFRTIKINLMSVTLINTIEMQCNCKKIKKKKNQLKLQKKKYIFCPQKFFFLLNALKI